VLYHFKEIQIVTVKWVYKLTIIVELIHMFNQ
jgi:hypothetical protein